MPEYVKLIIIAAIHIAVFIKALKNEKSIQVPPPHENKQGCKP